MFCFRSKDIFGNRLLNRTSAAHGSDLLYLFGPEMYRKFFNQGFQTFRFILLSLILLSGRAGVVFIVCNDETEKEVPNINKILP